MTTDRFGVPSNFFGEHPEDFYGVIGRIACLSALLERQLLVTYQTMTNATQDKYTRLSAHSLLEKARQEAEDVEDRDARQTLLDYFDRVGKVFTQRNDYIHNLWPAQASGRPFGWRPSRAKRADSDPPMPDEILNTTLANAKDFILELVSLAQERDRIYAAASVEQHRRLERGCMA